MSSNKQIEALQAALQPVRQELINHALYNSLQNIDHIRTFTEQHVYAVWDFMSLLKSLQRHLTCVTLPWVPQGNGNTRYLINEIVLGEETDVDEHGVRMSHFELYVKAMQQMGASTSTVEQFLQSLQNGSSVEKALQQQNLPASVQKFVNYTFSIIENAPAHVQAAVFTFGREDLIPGMFISMVKELSKNNPEVSTFKYYLERHIEVDGDHHSHLAMEMVSELCGNDESKWKEATAASLEALQHRKLLWDGVLELVK
ncbi:Protein of unknown function [Filimonas lacunae]|uniref:DUF3050 domain-containing protein n=1 Tax=Filimonas lacunae TaxID=477680 RepID=A0A173MPV4_9BACT|nr:DUF3050 domain-containing protein [Filimonas lacunae]BAV09674.1 remnant of a transposase gene protein [Filimonas lacunae]SIS77013.1 Protein of unknown function [Filimonas lacunae]